MMVNLSAKESLVSFLSWDSQYFGFNVAQISNNRVNNNSIKAILEFCQEEKINLLQFKCDAHHSNSIKIAEKNGFHFVDIRMTFEISINSSRNISMTEELEFRKAVLDDLPTLMTISDGIYSSSRYHFDCNFPKEKVDVFYQDWVRKAITGDFDDCLYVITAEKQIIGYCSIRREGLKKAYIGIVGMDKQFLGRGLGQKLIELVLNECQLLGVETVDVVTQGRNYQAQRLYQRCGFIINKLELYYHKWI